mgnify:CR=1 FL=1
MTERHKSKSPDVRLLNRHDADPAIGLNDREIVRSGSRLCKNVREIGDTARSWVWVMASLVFGIYAAGAVL